MNVKDLVSDIKRLIRETEFSRIMNPQVMSDPDIIPGTEQLTYGPQGNNLSWTYNQGAGAWDFFVLDKINSDILLIYMSRTAQMYAALGTGNIEGPLKRNFKDDLLRDKYPVFTVSKNWSL